MLTCLVLIADPPRCSECRKKMGMTMFENKSEAFAQIANSNEINADPLLDKYSKK